MSTYLAFALIGAIWSAAIARRKKLDVALHTVIGFLFGLVGVGLAYRATTNKLEGHPWRG